MRTFIAGLAALAIVGGAGFAFASAPRTYPGDNFTLRVDNSGAIHKEYRDVYEVERIKMSAAELPASPPADEPPVAPVEAETDKAPPETAPSPKANPAVRSGDDCTLPVAAVSSTDSIEPFSPPSSRFSKVPKYLVAIYERACRDYRVPVRYLVADGSYETHFREKAIGDGGTSCGIHQMHDSKRTWKGWFAGGLADCHNAEKNIRTTADSWRKMLDGGRTIAQAIKRHNGSGPRADKYMRTVMSGADRYYAN